MRRGRKAPFSCDPDAMPEPIARLYLATPPIADAEAFAPRLAEACAAGEVAAVLLRLQAADERTLVKRVKAQQHRRDLARGACLREPGREGFGIGDRRCREVEASDRLGHGVGIT